MTRLGDDRERLVRLFEELEKLDIPPGPSLFADARKGLPDGPRPRWIRRASPDQMRRFWDLAAWSFGRVRRAGKTLSTVLARWVR